MVEGVARVVGFGEGGELNELNGLNGLKELNGLNGVTLRRRETICAGSQPDACERDFLIWNSLITHLTHLTHLTLLNHLTHLTQPTDSTARHTCVRRARFTPVLDRVWPGTI